jgi:galactokinase
MDQYVSSAASAGSLLLIDCRSLEYQTVTLPDIDSVVVVVANSNVKHDIAGGEYPNRVAQCAAATKVLKENATDPGRIFQLRDATFEDVLQAQEKMDDVIYRRARHVVTENARTLACTQALENADYVTAGQLMYQSHLSMRDDYEVSCTEIDVLVEIAMSADVYGSRLTGGGFGGCTVSLVQKDKVEQLVQLLQAEYPKRTDGLHCDCFVTSPAAGARVIAKDAL